MPSRPTERFEPGARIGSRYRIVALLGRGGMGEVYRADDLELGQSVALKMLPTRVANNPVELDRIRSEARVARQVTHPNVCRIHDLVQSDGQLFLSMEYVDGEDLASVLRRLGRPSPEKGIEIARQLCLGLAAAHEAGMVHRDLKPANVMIDGRGRVRLMDFGLAGLAEDLAREGAIAGTPAYMAPEQLAEGKVSIRSDVFSLGLILHEIFTGKPPHTATDLAGIRAWHRSESSASSTASAGELDPTIEGLIERCLARDPALRPASAYAVLAALPGADPLVAALAAGHTPSPELVANAGGVGSWPLRSAALWLAAILAMIVAGIALDTPQFRALSTPPATLALRADDLLTKLGHQPLPRFRAEGFVAENDAVVYWRRYSPRPMEPADIHRTLPTLADSPPNDPGSILLLYDAASRLLALLAVESRTEPRPGRAVDWSLLHEAAGLGRLRSIEFPSGAPFAAGVAWQEIDTGRVVVAAERNGQVTRFARLDSGRSTLDLLLEAQAGPPQESELSFWLGMAIYFVPLIACLVLATVNLRRNRADRRSANRIAGWVFLFTALEGVFPLDLAANGLPASIFGFVFGRPLAHGCFHALMTWIIYIAVEPAVRRIWPGLLVAWVRLTSGRHRDPLVGRHLVQGVAFGATATLLISAARHFWPHQAALLPRADQLETMGGLDQLGVAISYSSSNALLGPMAMLMMGGVIGLLTRRRWAAIVGTLLLFSAVFASGVTAWASPMEATILGAIGAGISIAALYRGGLLIAVVGTFSSSVLGQVPATLDPGAWQFPSIAISVGIVVSIAIYGAWQSVGGSSALSSLFSD